MIIYLAILTVLALAGAINESEKHNRLSAVFWGVLVLGLATLTVIAWHIGAHIEQ